MLKRAFDIILAASVLALLSPLLALIALAVLWDSGRPIFFSQIRVGRRFQQFRIYKFRSMLSSNRGPAITAATDARITRVGRMLRTAKLDELPQLWNVMVGDMSLVGPRPEIPRYVEIFRGRYQTVLSVRPGITDLASLQFRDEEQVLAQAADPLGEYESVVLPAKLNLAEEYVQRQCFALDLSILWRTLCVCLAPHQLRWPSNTTSHRY